jgi:YegS/Rv2252/BmrU family lipid kinase
MRRLVLIANPHAGANAMNAVRRSHNRRRILASAIREFRASGFSVTLHLESEPGAVEEYSLNAARSGADVIVAAGGDGTINAVTNGMLRAKTEMAAQVKSEAQSETEFKTALGVLPQGTGNVFAFNMGIRRNWRDACRIITDGHTRLIDVGIASKPRRLNVSRYFLLMAGIGYDAKVIEETSLRMKWMLRDYAYALKTLENVLTHRGSQVTLRLDGEKTHANIAWMIMVGNAASYAWKIKVTPHAEIDDGMLDVCLVPFQNNLVSFQQAMQILSGQHVERGVVEYWQVRTLRVESSPNVPIQLDGDEWGQTPIELSILPSALRVLAPAAADSTE